MHKEHQNIEWKESWRDEYLKWICGFANAQGGAIFIGKDDHGNVVGIDNAKELLEILPNKIRDVLGIIVDINLLSEDGKEIIEIKVDAYPSPVNYKGQYHFRSGSTKQELKGPALDRFLLQKQGLHWDAVSIPKIKVSDLDIEAFNKFRSMAKRSGRMEESVMNDIEDHILENLRLKDGDHIRRAGALLFHKDPEKFALGAYIKIGFSELMLTFSIRMKYTEICFLRRKKLLICS